MADPRDAFNAGPAAADELTLDGNAVAGLLATAFGTEMTAVPGECTHCATVSLVGSLRAYVHGPGVVLRCPACSGVVMRIVERPERLVIDVRGAAWLRIAR